MTDPNFYLVMSAAGLAGLGMVTGAGLVGWRGWLDLKRQELRSLTGADTVQPATGTSTGTAGARIEIADLKERIRKLEAIAAGVDL